MTPRLTTEREPPNAMVRKTANVWFTIEEWAQLKSEAALKRMQLREYLEMIIRERRKG